MRDEGACQCGGPDVDERDRVFVKHWIYLKTGIVGVQRAGRCTE